ncbi:hypothetical protein SDC9_04043 [bioreactor metagenome]|uniref:Uncharacterized protein n=1 Tax=bioreactor metagenome TaxID=1076179 RepID=A0A644SUY4_9ZZZZ|nr:hypothetical protein [Negativicutes bacterium]
MMWYLLGIILSLVVFFYGNSVGMGTILKWTIIALIWAASAHMDMKTKEQEKANREKNE